jgi:tRNA modification GTPase
MYKEDTIAAIATPPGEGGVAIVRASGPDSERIAKEIFRRAGGRNGALRSHTLHYGTVRNPESEETLDQALVVLMRKPRSYTGEDVFEVHCHGGPLVAREILELILTRGARHAEPGEFTKRAFLNGRLDLAQAEGVLDLIRARTRKGMSLALDQAQGGLSKWVGELREELLDILAQVEASIDFPEEEIELLQRNELAGKIGALKEKVSELIASYEWGRLFRDGARVCIAGRPNVGKSSLLNALLGEERVIVTPVPGTTRDAVEETINLGGLPVALSDMAGIRQTHDPVEKIGVDFSLKRLEAADATVIVLDGSEPHTAEDRSVMQAVQRKRGIVAINKSDLLRKIDSGWIAAAAGDKSLVSVSAKQGQGLDELKQMLRNLLLDLPSEPPIMVTNLRHKAALEKGERALIAAVEAIRAGLAPELIGVELQEAKDGLEEIIGAVTNNNILERVFESFCIGK